MCSIGIMKSDIRQPVFASQSFIVFVGITLILVNLCWGLDQNTSLTLESWLNDHESGYDEIIASCLNKCGNEDKYYGNLQTVGCQSYKDLCSHGCNKWKFSTLSTCKHVCHDDTYQSDTSPCDLACISGCNEAIYGIMDHVWKLPDFQTPLILGNVSANDTSLTLVWPIDQQRVYSTERLVIQWSYAETPQKWRYTPNFHWIENYTCVIEKLQPYTKYRFRVTMMVTTDHSNFVFSTESEVLLTPPMGVPSSAPKIRKVFALDHDKIAVFWNQGRFINARLEGYKIWANSLEAGDNSSTEVIVNASDSYTILHNLQSQRSYDIKVSMINTFGEGPSAMAVASTTNVPQEKSYPTFIVAEEYNLTLVNIAADGASTKELYKNDFPILGFDVLIDQETFFISDDSEHIYRINLNNEAERVAILTPKLAINFKPSILSVDWLNSFLYILGENEDKWLIARTGLNGNDLKIILEDLNEKPLELLVDPINGYIFWITLESGIFRLNIADESLDHIYADEGIATLTTDPKRFLLTIYSRTKQTFLQITYDGNFVLNEYRDDLGEHILGLIQDDSVLYWTDGKQIYSNQSVTDLHQNFHILRLFESTAQLTPNPNDPPRDVQALVTADQAKLSWKSPDKGYFQSAAAWSDWNYELEVREDEVSVSIRNIMSEYFTVEKLKPDTEYWFRVRATNSKGIHGSWSEEFRSKTWTASEDRFMLWATSNGLLQTNEVADNVETLLNGSITSLRWVNGTLFVAQDSQLGILDASNLTSFVKETIAESIAFDRKGQKLYYTDESKGAVIRTNLDKTERELIPIFGVRQMALDSENGYMYYSTGLRIEACSLSGRSCMTYYRTSLFSEEDVIGPALDFKNGNVLWITQSDRDGILFSAPMAHKPKTDDEFLMTPLEGFPAADWLSYSSGRLMWSVNETTVVFADEKGENPGLLRFAEMIYGVQVVEPSLKIEELDNIIPEAVNSSTIEVTGFWDEFNITWEPVIGSKVSYSIKIEDDLFMESFETTIRYPRKDLPPYSPLKIWITSTTPWNNGPTTAVGIFSPTAAPSEPQRLRIFINRIDNPLHEGHGISAEVRWEPPAEPNGPIVYYTVTCQKGDESFSTKNSSHLEALFYGLEDNVTYSFQVQAFTSGAGGNMSELTTVKVNSKFQSVPRILLASGDHIGILDMDLNVTEILTTVIGPVSHLVTVREENRMIWINDDGQLMSYFKQHLYLLSFLESDIQALTVDWISRIVYWSQADQGGGSTIHTLNLNHFEGEPLSGKLLISNPKSIKDLVMLPFSQSLIWLEMDGVLNGWNLRDLNEITLLLDTNLTYQRLYPGSFEQNVESVVLVDEMDDICSFDLQTKTCQVLKIGMDSPNMNIAWDNGFVYALKNHSIRAYNRQKQSLEYMVNIDDISAITALSLQPYPERKCLLPDYDEEPLVETNLLVPQLLNKTENSLEMRLPKIMPPPECGFKVPGLKYNVYLKEITPQNSSVKEIHCFDSKIKVSELKPYTRYTVQLEVSNYYADIFGHAKVMGPGVNFITAPGTPSQPRNITVSAVSPRDGLVEWMHPEVLNNDRVWYEIHWQTENPTQGVVHRHQKIITEGDDKWNFFLLSGLRPDHTYQVWIKVFSQETAFNTSSTYMFDTFPEPEGLAFVDSTAYTLTVSWNSSANITSAFLLYRPIDIDDPISVNITSDSHARVIESLEPKTKYSFHIKLFYSHSVHSYVWPPDNRFVFETLADRPSAPGQPLIQHIKREVFKIFWEPARSNGAAIKEYSLEALQSSHVKRVRRSHYFQPDDDMRVSNKTMSRLGQLPWAEELEPVQDKWIAYYNGTETNCIITELHTMRLLMFRVRARNSFGWGPYSDDSEMIAEPFVSPRKRDTLVFAIIAPITIVSTCVIMTMLIRYIQSRRKHAKKLIDGARPSIWGLDVATLQQVARSRNFSQTSSMLYTGKPLTDGDIALLPQIGREQIDMHKFLGSGAFGEVYEGLVTYDEDLEQDRVAIKTLRKGASEQEKTELLQEAHLMSHFKHENIVKLIGVCFDLDSICIIMELMEGGDLQSYLRHARPNLSKLGSLSLLDLVGMCLDVCTGCRYLEDLHFLHRDLACRNCLVSSMDPQYRVVKIGDFGLARDIYKSDYYRKEGEGLLPVRWMAPECLVDGVFTSQSDIWSFGVLLWEILSLGQQPYPAQSNLEVLNFVKEGGRLQQPEECPDKLYKIMMQCWSHDPEDRPTFQQCLNELVTMKVEILNKAHAMEYEGPDYNENQNDFDKSLFESIAGITNLSFAESDDEKTSSKVSVSSRDDNPSSLNSSYIGQTSSQRNQAEDSGSELNSLRVGTQSEPETNGDQPKRKSVHYVNEGRSRF